MKRRKVKREIRKAEQEILNNQDKYYEAKKALNQKIEDNKYWFLLLPVISLGLGLGLGFSKYKVNLKKVMFLLNSYQLANIVENHMISLVSKTVSRVFKRKSPKNPS